MNQHIITEVGAYLTHKSNLWEGFEMTSFRNIVIGTNLFFFGFGVLLILIVPPESVFSTIGKVNVIMGVFADIFIISTISSLPPIRSV